MKYVNLRLPDDEHARMVAAAEHEFVPVTALLRKLFAEYERQTLNTQAQRSQPAPTKINKRDQAFEEYHTLMADLPSSWTEPEYQRVRSTIESLRVQGGNIPHTDMPLPRSMVAWKNAQQGAAGFEQYEGMTHEQIVELLDAFEAKGLDAPNALWIAYRASKPAIPE